MLSTAATLEALLFAAGEPLSRKQLAALTGATPADIDAALTALQASLASRGLALIEVKDTVELRTSPDAANVVKKLRESELSRDLGKAGLETLAIILYRNGATRGQIDWVRGVNSSTALRSLLLRGLIARKDDPADRRRALYEPTPDALGFLGVRTLAELPRFEELSGALTQEGVRQEAAENHDGTE